MVSNLNRQQTNASGSLRQKQRKQEIQKASGSDPIMFEQALVIVDSLVFAKEKRHLMPAEIIVLKGGWHDADYEEIAKSENSRFTLNYLQRNIGPRLWDLLSEIAGDENETIDKKRLRGFLEKIALKYYNDSPDLNMLVIKGDKPPKIAGFCGRRNELNYLKSVALKQQCIVLTGIPGIGKSALVSKLLSEISTDAQPLFSQLIWKSLARGPSLEELVSELLELLLEPKQVLPENLQAKIALLIKQMHIHRCIIALDIDDINVLLNSLASDKRHEYQVFFRRLVEERHQSCVVLTCRILPAELEDLLQTKRSIEHIKLEGLDLYAAREMLFALGLPANKDTIDRLIEDYGGHPSELEAIAQMIKACFGNAEEYVSNQTTLISRHLKVALRQQFNGQELSEVHIHLIIYIAETLSFKERDPSSSPLGIHQIIQYFELNHPEIQNSMLIEAINDLRMQGLIEISRDTTNTVNYTLRPAVKKFILSQRDEILKIVNNGTITRQSQLQSVYSGFIKEE